MVLDVRHEVSSDNASAPAPSGPALPAIDQTDKLLSPGASEHGDSGGDLNLETLLNQVVEAESLQEQATAVAQLRAAVPGGAGIRVLSAVVENKSDARRLVAAQALGFHRHWLAAKTGEEQLLAWVRGERDPQVGAALVWGLRNREAVQEFLLHRDVGLAREAAFGMPLSENTLPALVTAVLVGQDDVTARVLLEKLGTIQRRQLGTVVDLLVEWPAPLTVEALTSLLERLPQLPLFELLLERKGMPEWDPQQRGGRETDQARNWHQLASLAEKALLKAPGGELIRYLIGQSARDDAFARRHASFLRSAVNNTDTRFGPDLLGDLERLTRAASEDRLARMAQMLLELSHKLDAATGDRADALLEEWKSKSPDLKLKIYHMQQGLR